MSATSDDEVPILVLGEARRTALLAKIRATLDDWCTHWSSTVTLRVAIETAADVQRRFTETTTGSRWRLTGSGSATHELLIFYRGELATDLLEVSPCMTAVEWAVPMVGGEMAQAVQSQIAQSFCEYAARLFGVGTEVASEAKSLRDSLDEPRMRRWIHVSISLGSGRPFAWLSLHPAAVSVLLPSVRGVPGAPLEGRRSALSADAAVTLEAVLGEAEVTLAELTALNPGDVVVLEQSLNASAELRTTLGKRVVATQLGRIGEKRALTVMSA